MIVPIKCMTCNKTIADVYDYYIKETEKLAKKSETPTKKQAADDLELRHFEKVRTGAIMDKLGLTRYCCRRILLGTVDMMDTI